METHTNHTLKANSIYPTTTKNRVSFGFIEHEKKYTIWNLVIQQRTHIHRWVFKWSVYPDSRAVVHWAEDIVTYRSVWKSFGFPIYPLFLFFLSLDSSVVKVDMWLCVNSYVYEENKSNTIESFEIGNRPMNEKKKADNISKSVDIDVNRKTISIISLFMILKFFDARLLLYSTTTGWSDLQRILHHSLPFHFEFSFLCYFWMEESRMESGWVYIGSRLHWLCVLALLPLCFYSPKFLFKIFTSFSCVHSGFVCVLSIQCSRGFLCKLSYCVFKIFCSFLLSDFPCENCLKTSGFNFILFIAS